jgi:hypothetical protein
MSDLVPIGDGEEDTVISSRTKDEPFDVAKTILNANSQRPAHIKIPTPSVVRDDLARQANGSSKPNVTLFVLGVALLLSGLGGLAAFLFLRP